MGQPARTTPSSNLRPVRTSSRVSSIPSDHSATLAHADLRRGVGEECPGERGPRLEELRDGADALAAFLLGHRQEIAARRFFRDPAQGELADHFSGLTGRTKRQVRGALRQEALLFRHHQRPQQSHPGSRHRGPRCRHPGGRRRGREAAALPAAPSRWRRRRATRPRHHRSCPRRSAPPARRAAPRWRRAASRCAALEPRAARDRRAGTRPDAAPRTRGRPPGRRRRRGCRAGRRSARGESAFRSRARSSVAGRRSRRTPR